MIQYLYLGRVAYDAGLRLQAEVAALVAEGWLQNVLLLLEHPPVLTLGRNANRANVVAGEALLAARGVTVHEINRGGDVTYHGPGQLVGYPIFDLRSLRTAGGGRMGPVDFVRGMEEALIRVCGAFGIPAGRVSGLTGVWCGGAEGQGAEGQSASRFEAETERKIAAIGIHVAKGITSHGFALNVTTDLRDFELIVPCGIPDHAVTSLEREMHGSLSDDDGRTPPPLETVAHQAALSFGMVFNEQVLAVESLEALLAQARGAAAGELKSPDFPGEDTPLLLPPELRRMRGEHERPIQA